MITSSVYVFLQKSSQPEIKLFLTFSFLPYDKKLVYTI